MSRNAKVKKQLGQRADWGKKNCRSILVLVALRIMGIWKVRDLILNIKKLIIIHEIIL
jgi:hypothetical protein